MTKLSSALRIDSLSGLASTSTGAVVTLPSVSVMPSSTFDSVLLSDAMGSPFRLADALAAASAWAIVRMPADGSKASADRPRPSRLLPSLSVTPTRKPLASPVAAERSTRRAPLASVSTEATTPEFEALILSRSCASDSAGGPTVMSTAVAPALGVKLVCPAPQVPSSMCSVPSPTSASAEAYTPVALDCTEARRCTSIE